MTQYFGYIEAVHYAAAKLGVQEYIADELRVLDISVWDFIHNFEDDAIRVVEWGLYEHLHDLRHRPTPLAIFWLVCCRNGCYRLPTENERKWLDGISKTTVSA